MDEMDDRFAHVNHDPRFKSIPRKEKKVHIDKRFQSMFHDKRFKLHYAMDKRGRPLQHSTSEDLKKYYDVSSSSSDEDEVDDFAEGNEQKMSVTSKVKLSGKESQVQELVQDKPTSEDESGLSSADEQKVDLARGEGNVESSSEEESSEDEDDNHGFDHQWGEMDARVEKADELSSRLAVCNMDWDRIKAKDLFVLFNNFKPLQGSITSVKIYPSEYGLERMKEEEVRGPPELTRKTLKDHEYDMTETKEGSKYHMETLRQYQLNRLRYYYAVVDCDSVETANSLYTDLDGMEYESSASQLDLRFIPDSTEFDQMPSSVCDTIPDMSTYQPVLFITKALQQTMVELTWDETNPDRVRTLQRAFQEDGAGEDLSAYLASSSDDEEEEDPVEDDFNPGEKVKAKVSVESQIAKYKALLSSLDESEQKKKKKDIEMEITWEPGLKDRTEKLIRSKQQKEEMTCFEQYLNKKKEARRQKKKDRKAAGLVDDEVEVEDDDLCADDDIPSDVDLNDPFFKEEFQGFQGQKSKKKAKGKQKVVLETDSKTKAELELLFMDDDNKKHFNLKDLVDDTSLSKRKKRKMKQAEKDEKKLKKEDDFKINMDDDRFSALFSSADFNIDPSDTHFRKTKVMETLILEKQRRRTNVKSAPKKEPKTLPTVMKDPALSMLVKSVKSKAQNFKKKH